jgi:hypothetical protein
MKEISHAKKIIILTLFIGLGFSYYLFQDSDEKDGINYEINQGSDKASDQKRITTQNKSYKGEVRLSFKPEMSQAERITHIERWKERVELETDSKTKEELIQEAVVFFESIPADEEKSLKYNIANVLARQNDNLSIKKLAALIENSKEEDFNFILNTTKLLNDLQQAKTHHLTIKVAKEVLEANKHFILDESHKNIEIDPKSEQAGLVNDSLIFSNQLKMLENELMNIEQVQDNT